MVSTATLWRAMNLCCNTLLVVPRLPKLSQPSSSAEDLFATIAGVFLMSSIRAILILFLFDKRFIITCRWERFLGGFVVSI